MVYAVRLQASSNQADDWGLVLQLMGEVFVACTMEKVTLPVGVELARDTCVLVYLATERW